MSSLSIVYVCTMRFVCVSVCRCCCVSVCRCVGVSVWRCVAVYLLLFVSACTYCVYLSVSCVYLCLPSCLSLCDTVCVYCNVHFTVVHICFGVHICLSVRKFCINIHFIHIVHLNMCYIYVHTCMWCVYVHTCMYTCVCVCICVYMPAHLYIWLRVTRTYTNTNHSGDWVGPCVIYTLFSLESVLPPACSCVMWHPQTRNGGHLCADRITVPSLEHRRIGGVVVCCPLLSQSPNCLPLCRAVILYCTYVLCINKAHFNKKHVMSTFASIAVLPSSALRSNINTDSVWKTPSLATFAQ